MNVALELKGGAIFRAQQTTSSRTHNRCCADMQIRLDPDNANYVERNAKAHRRIFKRRKSYAAIVNEMLRDMIGKNGKPEPNTP